MKLTVTVDIEIGAEGAYATIAATAPKLGTAVQLEVAEVAFGYSYNVSPFDGTPFGVLLDEIMMPLTEAIDHLKAATKLTRDPFATLTNDQIDEVTGFRDSDDDEDIDDDDAVDETAEGTQP